MQFYPILNPFLMDPGKLLILFYFQKVTRLCLLHLALMKVCLIPSSHPSNKKIEREAAKAHTKKRGSLTQDDLKIVVDYAAEGEDTEESARPEPLSHVLEKKYSEQVKRLKTGIKSIKDYVGDMTDDIEPAAPASDSKSTEEEMQIGGSAPESLSGQYNPRQLRTS